VSGTAKGNPVPYVIGNHACRMADVLDGLRRDEVVHALDVATPNLSSAVSTCSARTWGDWPPFACCSGLSRERDTTWGGPGVRAQVLGAPVI
jgi:hypothetical protein